MLSGQVFRADSMYGVNTLQHSWYAMLLHTAAAAALLCICSPDHLHHTARWSLVSAGRPDSTDKAGDGGI